jgi:O-antigen/teichoic acid export membrane protein
MPRYYSEEELGGYFLAMFITNLIASIAELGMQAPLIREMTLHPQEARHFAGNALIIRILLSLVAFGIMVGSGHLLGYPSATLQMIYLLGLSEVMSSIAQIFRCVFRAFEQMKYEAFIILTERILVVLVGGVLMILEIGLVEFCLIVLIVSLLGLSLSVGIALRRFISLRFKFDLEVCRILMRQALPFSLGNIFNLIYFRIDAVMLEKLSPHGVAANAWYGLAYTIINGFTILPGAFMGAMFPVMSRAYEDDKIDFRPIYTDALRWMFLLGTPFAVGMTILAKDVVSFFPADYNQAAIAPALSLLSWSGGLTFLTTLVVTVLRATDKRRAFTALMGATALLNIGLNAILIPRFSHIGAALTMIISEGFLFLAGFVYISYSISKPTQGRFAIKAVVVSALMGAGLWLLHDRLSIWLLVPAALVFYFGAMAALREIWWKRSSW